MGKELLGRENSRCKGPAVGMSLECSRNYKASDVVEVSEQRKCKRRRSHRGKSYGDLATILKAGVD